MVDSRTNWYVYYCAVVLTRGPSAVSVAEGAHATYKKAGAWGK